MQWTSVLRRGANANKLIKHIMWYYKIEIRDDKIRYELDVDHKLIMHMQAWASKVRKKHRCALVII